MFPLTCQCDGARWVAAAHRVDMDTLRVWLGFIRGLTLLSRHHSPSLSIVDEFNYHLTHTLTNKITILQHYILTKIFMTNIQRLLNCCSN